MYCIEFGPFQSNFWAPLRTKFPVETLLSFVSVVWFQVFGHDITKQTGVIND